MKPEIANTMSSDLVTIGWTESMDSAFTKMRGWNVRHLPVTDETGAVIGILSDRDVQRAMRSDVRHAIRKGPQFDGVAITERIEFAEGAMVRDYMNFPVISVDIDADLRTTAGRMVKEKISSVLITKNKRTVGIVTAEDLLKVLIMLLDEPGPGVQWSLMDLVDRTSGKLARFAI